MRIFGFLILFFTLRVFEVAVFPAVASFYVPFTLWYAVLLFSLLPFSEVLLFIALISAIEFFLHLTHPAVFPLSILASAASALVIRFFLSKEGTLGTIAAFAGALLVFRVLAPIFWIAAGGAAGAPAFTVWARMIHGSDIALDAFFVVAAGYGMFRRERKLHIERRAYV